MKSNRLYDTLLMVTRWLLPPRCAGCQGNTALLYCPDCLAKLPIAPMAHVLESGITVVSLLPYGQVTKQILHHIKFSGDRDMALAMADRIAEALKQTPIPYTLGVPVPSVSDRTAERGFHHVETLFEALCHQWQLPLVPAVIRHKDTQALHHLDRKSRSSETENAFTVIMEDVVQDQHVLILDDILTTGATLDAMAISLMSAGAASVQSLVLATGKRL